MDRLHDRSLHGHNTCISTGHSAGGMRVKDRLGMSGDTLHTPNNMCSMPCDIRLQDPEVPPAVARIPALGTIHTPQVIFDSCWRRIEEKYGYAVRRC
jgi:hypothetical protein